MKSSKQYHICLAANTLGSGGIGRNLVNLSKELVCLGVKVDVLLTAREDNHRERDLPPEVRVFRVASHTRYALLPVRKYLLTRRPDGIISAHDHVNALILICKVTLGRHCISKVICTFRTFRQHQLRKSSLRIHCYDWLLRRLLTRADHLVAVSDGVARGLERDFGMERGVVKTIYNPAWTAQSEQLSKENCDHPWLADKDRPVIISVGRLTAQKDFSTLIKAFGIFLKVVDARLILLGSGEDKSLLQEQVRKENIESSVDFVGHVENPLAYMRRADLFVLSSRWEGFGNVLVEALGCGLPIVSTDCESGPAEILDDGRFGHLVPVGDAEAMSDAMLIQLAKERSPSRQTARARRFSAEFATGRYLALVYEDKEGCGNLDRPER